MKKKFEINGINIINEDCLTALQTFKKHSFDACITDPPYNISGYDGKKEIGWLKTNSFWKEEKRFDITNEVSV